MTEKIEYYRGYKVPNVTGGGNQYSWVLNDGNFGYFTGTKEDVLNYWKRAVDAAVLRDAIYDGGYERVWDLGDLLACPRCGSAVADVPKHSERCS